MKGKSRMEWITCSRQMGVQALGISGRCCGPFFRANFPIQYDSWYSLLGALTQQLVSPPLSFPSGAKSKQPNILIVGMVCVQRNSECLELTVYRNPWTSVNRHPQSWSYTHTAYRYTCMYMCVHECLKSML